MTLALKTSRGMYFEEFEVGASLTTASRTITEADIETFAELTGDNNLIHVDAEYAAKTQFGQRIAHGMLILSIATGLVVQTGVMEGTIIAFREVAKMKFSNPVFIGDAIHAILMVKEVKSFPRLGGGQIGFDFVVKNQDGKTNGKGEWRLLMMSDPDKG